MKYPSHLLKVIDVLKKLPGVGSKSAERYAFHLLTRSESELREMADVISCMHDELRQCEECGCLMEGSVCFFCDKPQRDKSTICVIASPKDAYAIEETREYRGLYHVIGTLLSPLDGRGTGELHLDKLKKRIQDFSVQEVIIALDSTLEGDATALYLKRELAPLSVNTSRLAFGMPMGSSLEFVDGNTLAHALAGRKSV